jgi:hypothetical protein
MDVAQHLTFFQNLGAPWHIDGLKERTLEE